MTAPHWINLGLHVAAGAIGILLGFVQLSRRKGDEAHRTTGRRFVAVTMIVTGTAILGNLFFRFTPLFAVLAVLATYQTISGLRVARTREAGPAGIDLAWTLLGLAAGAALVPIVLGANSTASTQPVVIWSSLGALAFLLTYDLLRWTFPRRWHARLWEAEHIYKIVSSLFGMISAFVGNVVRWGQPWSQVLPSAVGLLTIAWFITATLRAAPRMQRS